MSQKAQLPLYRARPKSLPTTPILAVEVVWMADDVPTPRSPGEQPGIIALLGKEDGLVQALVSVRCVPYEAIQTSQQILPLWTAPITHQLRQRSDELGIGDDDVEVLHRLRSLAVRPSPQLAHGRIDHIIEEAVGHRQIMPRRRGRCVPDRRLGVSEASASATVGRTQRFVTVSGTGGVR